MRDRGREGEEEGYRETVRKRRFRVCEEAPGFHHATRGAVGDDYNLTDFAIASLQCQSHNTLFSINYEATLYFSARRYALLTG